MSKSRLKPDIKTKLIGELVIMTYFLGAVLVNKYIHPGSGTGLTPILIWIIVWGVYSVYDKKYSDIVDEASKQILSNVNEVAIKMILYSIGVIAVFFSTPYTQNINISNLDIGIILVVVLFIQSLLKLSLFMYFDRKGIYD